MHGAYSPRRIDPLAAEIAAELLATESTPDHLRRAEFAPAVAAWARAEAVCRLMWSWLAGQDIEAALADVTKTAETEEAGQGRTTRRSVSKQVTSVIEQLRRWEAHAATLRGRLGLDPVSAGRLAKDLAGARWFVASSPLEAALSEAERERRAAIEAGSGEERP